MKRFVLWLIRKFLNASDIVDVLVDTWCARDQTKYHARELGFLYKNASNEHREFILADLHQITRFDKGHDYIRVNQLIAMVLSQYMPNHHADVTTSTLLLGAILQGREESNFIKLTANLTNLVKDNVEEISSTDLHLLVALLRKRVNNECN